jgi:hypothetical protein
MPWRCPACEIQIVHSTAEPMPRRNVTYRCHICRLELVLDPKTNKLVLAPIDPDEP